MDPKTLALLMRSGQFPGLLGLREGEWNASKKKPEERMNVEGLLATPEMSIPDMHKGKMLNLMNRGWSDGRAHSLDAYIQPSISPKGIGLNGAGLLYRRVW
jgi:hypothetical protein